MSQPNNNTVSPLIKTLIYSSLFHFPLSKDELWRYCITDTALNKDTFSMLVKTTKGMKQKGSYFFLTGDEQFVDLRLSEKENYKRKLSLAQKGARILSFIPSIRFIGISGSLAAGSANADSDIDFFIITASNTVWVSRLLAILLLSMVNLRRKRGVRKAPNKICLNIFMAETALHYFTSSKELYTAHELAQLYPLLNRNKTYEQLLAKNTWYLTYLPHAHPRKNQVISTLMLGAKILRIIDPICSFFQIHIMRKHQTKEVITNELIFLHPHDYKEEILSHFKQKMIEYDSLTKA